MSLRSFLKQRFVTPATDAIIDRIPKPVGTFGYDPWGYNTDAAKLGLEALKPLYEKYFRVEAFGLENVPKEGRVLVIANHSGQLPMDGMLIGYAMATNPHGPRSLRVMIERFFPTVPFLGNLMNELGGVVGDPENCARMLQSDEAIIVFPEGVRGSGKTWDKRYQLQRFGLGFMHLAITENTPILPVGVVGCEETMPTPFHLTTIARMFGIPYFPVTTPVPLPAKVRLYFGEPMRFEGPVTDEDDVALKVEQVKEAINGLIARGLRERQGVVQMMHKHKPEILVTGAGGALAQHVIQELKRDYHIVQVDFRRRVPRQEGMSSYRVEYNKRGFEDIFRKHRIEGVIHLGRMGLYESTHRNRYNHNVLGTQRLLDLAHKYGVTKVVVLSTYFVYGASPYNPALLSEEAPLKASELTMDLVDSVELENLANIYLWKYPELNITILRPSNIAGPGVLNSMSLLLSSKYAPVLMGFSPMMQFIHVEDMGHAVALAFRRNKPGVYNVTTEDWISYQEAVHLCGCKRLPVPSVPEWLPKKISERFDWKGWPPYLLNYYKYPVIMDGSLFSKTFHFKPKRTLEDIFTYYREKKEMGIL